jgi:hypothetical protein
MIGQDAYKIGTGSRADCRKILRRKALADLPDPRPKGYFRLAGGGGRRRLEAIVGQGVLLSLLFGITEISRTSGSTEVGFVDNIPSDH